ncbi:MAG TPA: carbon storage regulator [Ktedonobacteraceae bacterium]|nr:carbon storage regulator [Ktedonobacteraceae bacterium]
MLVLRRKVGESIVLAGVINISVLAVEGERVKIGISAPPEITIVREELLRTAATDTTETTPDQNAPVQHR